VYYPYLKVSPSGVVNGPALVIFSGKKVLIYDQLLKSENMHKLAFFLCRWDEPDSFVKSGKFLQRRMVRI
uniref:hypothetical protein n=1 Tax=Escherichia coli TaxID=562 RepID=UPI001BC8422B